jgi:hypothetical protein
MREKKLTLRTLETIDKIGCLNFFSEIVSLIGFLLKQVFLSNTNQLST